MKERNMVLVATAAFLVFGLIGAIIILSAYLIIAAVAGLLLLPVWRLVLQKIDRRWGFENE